MIDFLERMERSSLARARAAREGRAESELMRRLDDLTPCGEIAMHDGGFDLIAEIKPRSPSAGHLVGVTDRGRATELAGACAEGGAAAISVLTEPDCFNGSLELLHEVSSEVSLPVMRKDFLVVPYQLLEARVCGASGVLLIVSMLPGRRLRTMLDTALELGMFVLLEALDAADLRVACSALESDRAIGRGQVLVGVNARDLRTLAMQPERLADLAGSLPADAPRVAESGLRGVDDVHRVAGLGYDLALVGETLMRAGDPASLTASMVRAGRAAKAGLLPAG